MGAYNSPLLGPSTNSLQLRSAYNMVTTLKGLSGFHWDDEQGMNIGVAETNAWSVYTTVHCIYL